MMIIKSSVLITQEIESMQIKVYRFEADSWITLINAIVFDGIYLDELDGLYDQ